MNKNIKIIFLTFFSILLVGGIKTQIASAQGVQVNYVKTIGAVAADKTCKETKNKNTDCSLKIECDQQNLDKSNCGIVSWLITFINVLSGLVGVVVIIMVIIGGIQYSTAGDDPQKVQAAKSKITNAVLALFVSIFMYSFLQWVVPGGLF